MAKLRVYNYLNRVLFFPSLKSCGLKNVMKLGGSQKKFKVTPRRGFQKNHAQLQFYKRFTWKIVKLSMFFLEASPKG